MTDAHVLRKWKIKNGRSNRRNNTVFPPNLGGGVGWGGGGWLGGGGGAVLPLPGWDLGKGGVIWGKKGV